MDRNKVTEMITELRRNGVDLEDIEKELDYRDNANIGWNDDLYEYSTEELSDIEQLWCKA